MVESIKKIILIITIVLVKGGFAQGFYFQPIIKHRISGGPLLSFFGKDPHTMKNVNPLFGYTVNYATEIELLDNTSILAGLTYTNQGVRFNGYYVVPGYTYLFDGTFAYDHKLRFQSLQLPLAVKFNLNLEEDNNYTPYFILGLGFTYIATSTSTIVSDSTEATVYKGKTDLEFEHHLIHKKVNCFAQGGFGIQRNMRKRDRALYIEFVYKYDFPRLHYMGHENSNSVFFRNTSLSIVAGIKL